MQGQLDARLPRALRQPWRGFCTTCTARSYARRRNGCAADGSRASVTTSRGTRLALPAHTKTIYLNERKALDMGPPIAALVAGGTGVVKEGSDSRCRVGPAAHAYKSKVTSSTIARSAKVRGTVPSRLPFRTKPCDQCGGRGIVTPIRREQLLAKMKRKRQA
jgi:hypothetical protein